MSVGCTGKVRFETFGEANRAARRARRQSDRAVKAYACRECHGFHVGANAKTPAYRERRAKRYGSHDDYSG